MKELGIEIVIQNELPKIDEAFDEFLSQLKNVGLGRKIKPSKKQAIVERTFPAIAKWVQSYGHIEIGDQEGFGFVVRALDYGGLVFDDDKAGTLAEAMAALEQNLAQWFRDNEWD